MKFSTGKRVILIILVVLLIDQFTKIWIKTNMQIGDSIEVFSWFHIYFTENNGMAFGLEIISKLFLTMFRIVVVGIIGFYLHKIIKRGLPFGFVASIALIFSGAIGNIIDSVFYGVIFDHSYGNIATLFPEGGGYSSWFHGRVVDMLYFPLIDMDLPSWLPIWGGEHFVFFRPIFNIADSAISIGVFLLLIFYRDLLTADQSEQ